MASFAIIGTRNPTKEQILSAISWVKLLSSLGHTICTGGAHGIDSVAMDYGKGIAVFLPWAGYNKEWIPPHADVTVLEFSKHHAAYESVRTYHPNPSSLTPGVVKLHARNYLIVLNSDVVIAYPSPEGGGTAQGIRIARGLKKPCFVYPFTDEQESQLIELAGAKQQE